MTVSLAEATAAARRIMEPRSLFSTRAQDELREDARLLAGFVLAGDMERLRGALQDAQGIALNGPPDDPAGRLDAIDALVTAALAGGRP